MEGKGLDDCRVFEDVEAPGGGGRGKSRFGWFVVFEDYGGIGDGVGFGGELAGGGVVGLLLFDFLFFGGVCFGVGGGRVPAVGGLLRGEGSVGGFGRVGWLWWRA